MVFSYWVRITVQIADKYDNILYVPYSHSEILQTSIIIPGEGTLRKDENLYTVKLYVLRTAWKYMAQPRSELLRTLTKSSMHVLETLTYWIRAIQISILVTWTANAALEDQRLRQQGSPPGLVSCDLHPVPLTVQASLQWPLPCHSRPEPVEGLQWSLPCRCLCESDQVL